MEPLVREHRRLFFLGGEAPSLCQESPTEIVFVFSPTELTEFTELAPRHI